MQPPFSTPTNTSRRRRTDYVDETRPNINIRGPILLQLHPREVKINDWFKRHGSPSEYDRPIVLPSRLVFPRPALSQQHVTTSTIPTVPLHKTESAIPRKRKRDFESPTREEPDTASQIRYGAVWYWGYPFVTSPEPLTWNEVGRFMNALFRNSICFENAFFGLKFCPCHRDSEAHQKYEAYLD